MSKPAFFELRIKASDNGKMGCMLYQQPPASAGAFSRSKPCRMSAIDGWRLGLAQGAIQRTIQGAGYKPVDFRATRKAPFSLNEEQGIRLDLVFRAVRDLRRRSRIEDVIAGIMAMSREELYYWHSKAAMKEDSENHGLIALRVLLGGENR
jgi:hypothetical protein